MQNSLENNLGHIEDTQTRSLLRYITNFGKSVIKYTGCKEIAEILDTTEPSSSDDIELIAKSLVVEDVNKITVYDLLLYDRIVIALREANREGLQDKSIEDCARKIRIMSINPRSVEYLLNMNPEEVAQEEDRMKELVVTTSDEDTKTKSSKKRQFTEEEEAKEEGKEETDTRKLQKEEQTYQTQHNEETEILRKESMWATLNDKCVASSSYRVRIPTSSLKGYTIQERLKHIKKLLGKNKHIKSVEEKAMKYNKWIELDFDCFNSRDAAIKEMQRENVVGVQPIEEEVVKEITNYYKETRTQQRNQRRKEVKEEKTRTYTLKRKGKEAEERKTNKFLTI